MDKASKGKLISSAPILHFAFCILHFELFFFLTFSGCTALQSSTPEPGSQPEPPEELFTTRVVYPLEPLVFDFELFQQSLKQLARQRTVLYVLGANAPFRAKDVTCLVELQTSFYRYGVQVMLLHLNPASNWPVLKKFLEANGGNFPAVYPLPDQLGRMKTFLKANDLTGYHVFVVDDKLRVQAGWPGPIDCAKLRQYVHDALRSVKIEKKN